MQTDDIIGGFTARGWGTTGFSGGRGSLIIHANEPWTDAAQSTYIQFNTAPLRQTYQTERMRIDNAGNVGIGTATPTAMLEVNGTAKFDGLVTFASGQTFPIASGAITDAMLANPLAGDLISTGTVTGATVNATTGFNLAGQTFAFGSAANKNVFLGFAGNSTMTGANNTASGYQAFFKNTTGHSNTASGYQALYSNTTGTNNNANGFQALYDNTTGYNNTASGWAALYYNTTGTWNTASGHLALNNTTTGGNNSALGGLAGVAKDDSSITGSNNTPIGANSVFGTGALNNAAAIGANAEVDVSNALVLGSINGINNATVSTNVGIGTTSPAYTLDVHGTANFTGPVTFSAGQTFPIASGAITDAMLANPLAGDLISTGTVTGSNVNATSAFYLGGRAFAFTSGNSNVFLGFAGNSVTASSYNTGSGQGALASNTTGSYNTASGANGLGSNTTGGANTASGQGALYYNTTGADNTGLGNLAGLTKDTTWITGSNNTAIGNRSTFATGTLSNATAIGANAEVDVSNALVLGSINGVNGATASTNVGIGTTSPAYTLDVNGTINATGFSLSGQPFAFGSFASQNVFLGFAGNSITTGSYNTASGSQALLHNTAGSYNTASGLDALLSNTTGGSNTASGYGALFYNSTGDSNTASGTDASSSTRRAPSTPVWVTRPGVRRTAVR